MKRYLFFFLFTSTLIGGYFYLYGYEGPSPLRDIRVEFSIMFDEAKRVYTYSYKITNPPVNDGEIWAVWINISRDPHRDSIPSMEGLSHCTTGYYDKHSSEAIFQRVPLIPVGSNAPRGWACGYGMPLMGSYCWAAVDEPYRIKPDSSLRGFELTSYGLPGIREIEIEPDIDLDRLPPEYEENLEKTITLEEKVKWTGKTVGPKAPPKVFVPIDFLTYIISLKHEAFSLGWITNKGVENSLDTKLDNARKKLEQGDIIAARNILNALINEVEAQGCRTYDDCPSGKHLTPEAYALLKYNTQYLINNLK